MDWSDKVEDVMMVLCTVPNEEVGVNLANCLVSEGLAACVNILPAIRSIYRWQGSVCDDSEWLLVIKLLASQKEALAQRVDEVHPYDTPELISVPVTGGSKKYLQWMRDQRL